MNFQQNQIHFTTPAYPTLYHGTVYGSELEAAWAAFFDLRGIVYEYEPAVALNGWRVDFAIELVDGAFGPGAVKPYRSRREWEADKPTLARMTEALGGRSEDVVLLGASAIMPSSFMFRMAGPEFELIDFGDPEDVANDWKHPRAPVRRQR